MKRKNGRKYYPPLQFVPADVGPDGKIIVPGTADGDGDGGHAKGNGVVKTESFKETEEERRKREEEEEKEELDRKVCACVWVCVCVCVLGWRQSDMSVGDFSYLAYLPCVICLFLT